MNNQVFIQGTQSINHVRLKNLFLCGVLSGAFLVVIRALIRGLSLYVIQGFKSVFLLGVLAGVLLGALSGASLCYNKGFIQGCPPIC